jgi:hypothetical protein
VAVKKAMGLERENDSLSCPVILSPSLEAAEWREKLRMLRA